MSKSISPISKDQSLKSNVKEIGMVSNLIFTTIQFILKHPILITSFGVVLQALLSSASGMNEKPNQYGNTTLLHREAAAGDFPAVQELVEHGFDIHAKDENGMTPIDLACEAAEEYSSIISYFESKGARSFCGMFQSKEETPPSTDEEPITCVRLK